MNTENPNIQEQLDRIEASLLNQKNILTFDEAAKFTGLSKSYLYKLTSANKIPFYRPSGKLLYFQREELETWLLQNRVSTSDELENKAQAYCMSNKIGGAK